MNTTQEQAQYIIDNAIVLDTETTGLRDIDQVVEVCAIKASTGEVLMDEIIYNDGSDVEQKAMDVHGITKEFMAGGMPVAMMAGALTGLKVHHGGFFTSYNIPFDKRLLKQTTDANAMPEIIFDGDEHPALDMMEVANRHLVAEYGVWDEEQSKFKRLSLSRCCEIAGIKYEGVAHRAYADTKAALDLMRAIAEGQV